MNKRVSWGFLAVSAVFFLFIVGLTGYRVEDTRGQDAALIRQRFPDLVARVSRAHQQDGAWDSPQLRSDLRGIFDAEPRLLLLSVHSPSEGILYLVTRNRWYLKDPAQITAEWRGTPSYQISKGYEDLLTGSLPDGQGNPTVDALYVIMGREDLYPIVRDDLYLFLAFLLVCGVFALIVTSAQQEEHPNPGRRDRSSQPARSPSPPAAPGPTAGFSRRDHEPAPQSSPRSMSADGRPAQTASGSPAPAYAPGSMMARLQAELQRTEAADEDLTLARVRIDPSRADAAAAHQELGSALREQFPLVDLLFEEADQSYSVLLPDTELDDALRSLDDLRKKMAATAADGRPRSVSVGASARSGRLIDARELREEAEISLAKAAREGGNQVIGFRADAARFRGLLRDSAL